MKSFVLCEGKDDIWFIGYYLYKKAGWQHGKNGLWMHYEIDKEKLNKKQDVEYYYHEQDSVAIWSVGGKDSFKEPIKQIWRLIEAFPVDDPIDSIVIIRDRDEDEEQDILERLRSLLPDHPVLMNKETAEWRREIDECPVCVNITPIIIPFNENGAIETLLMHAISEDHNEGHNIVEDAKKYIDALVENGKVGERYLTRKRYILKAKYSATIAVTNPDHSTSGFNQMVMSCPWEESEYVKMHLEVLRKAISSPTE